ncbi:MAG: cytochrome P450 [Ignavibacteriaceae bacterium]|nr:cytochrome P450 [Ignavibacteriaceae bacterium]
MKTFQKLAEKYGDVLCLKFRDDSVYFVNDPEVIKHILKTNYENYPRGKSIEDLKPLLGQGLFISEGELWKSQRKRLTPAFHNSQMESFYLTLNEELKLTNQLLEKAALNNQHVDLEYELKILLLNLTIKNLVSSNTFVDTPTMLAGLSLILTHTSNKQHYIRQILGLFQKKQLRIFDFKDTRAALNNLYNFSDRILDEVLNEKIKPGHLLSILIDAFKAGMISAQQVKDEIQTVLFAGYDTVAEGLLWLLYFLSKNEEANKKVLEELTILKMDFDLSKLGLNDTPYLTATIRETLRLMPPAWSFYRTVKETDSFNGYTFPRKAVIMISPYILHRNKKYWNDAEVFNPGRFAGASEIDPFEYIPFGQGPHICIGNRLALLEIHGIASTLLSKFKFNFVSPDKKIPETNPTVILSSKKKVRVVIEKRQ